MGSNHILSELEPKILFDHFFHLTQIPRPSKKEEGVRTFVKRISESVGAKVERDAIGNLLVRVPASKGMENRSTIMLQSHMDMVAEKTPDNPHVFDRDPIKLRLDRGNVYGTNTTLGADNGIGLCAALSVMTDPAVSHPPLELLFTMDEEAGMSGAKNVSFSGVKAKTLLNLDSEEPGTFTLGCAGGGDLIVNLKLKRKNGVQYPITKLSVGGFRGGHSGIQIHEGRVNAIQVLANILTELDDDKNPIPYELIDFQGGNLRNAIPRDAHAVVGLNDCQRGRLEKILAKNLSVLRQTEHDAKFSLEKCSESGTPVEDSQVRALLNALVKTTSGVIEWEQKDKELVRTSNNIGVARMTKEAFEFTNLTRSLVTSQIRKTMEPWIRGYHSAGMTTSIEGEYPGWTPNFKSELLKRSQEIHTRLTGKPATPVVIHAGLECGILTERLPPMEMISFGPMIYDAHSPKEYLEIKSVKPFWDLLCAMLKEL